MDGPSYYQRSAVPVGDGTYSFASSKDSESEISVAKLVEARWNCELHHFGKLSPIDWYATRHGRVTAVIEMKTRSHSADRFLTVFLNVRKWLALSLAEAGLGVPALYIVSFADEQRYIRVNEINASQMRVGGCRRVVKASSDIEPVIEVPVNAMKKLS